MECEGGAFVSCGIQRIKNLNWDTAIEFSTQGRFGHTRHLPPTQTQKNTMLKLNINLLDFMWHISRIWQWLCMILCQPLWSSVYLLLMFSFISLRRRPLLNCNALSQRHRLSTINLHICEASQLGHPDWMHPCNEECYSIFQPFASSNGELSIHKVLCFGHVRLIFRVCAHRINRGVVTRDGWSVCWVITDLPPGHCTPVIPNLCKDADCEVCRLSFLLAWG